MPSFAKYRSNQTEFLKVATVAVLVQLYLLY